MKSGKLDSIFAELKTFRIPNSEQLSCIVRRSRFDAQVRADYGIIKGVVGGDGAGGGTGERLDILLPNF